MLDDTDLEAECSSLDSVNCMETASESSEHTRFDFINRIFKKLYFNMYMKS